MFEETRSTEGEFIIFIHLSSTVSDWTHQRMGSYRTNDFAYSYRKDCIAKRIILSIVAWWLLLSRKKARRKKNWRVNPLSPSAPNRFHRISVTRLMYRETSRTRLLYSHIHTWERERERKKHNSPVVMRRNCSCVSRLDTAFCWRGETVCITSNFINYETRTGCFIQCRFPRGDFAKFSLLSSSPLLLAVILYSSVYIMQNTHSAFQNREGWGSETDNQTLFIISWSSRQRHFRTVHAFFAFCQHFSTTSDSFNGSD